MRGILAFALATSLGLAAAKAEPIAVVAAENFYGDVAEQVGGSAVKVTSILTNPDQDPHLFEASASTARALAAARIVIYNGADYDPWMSKLLSASRATGRITIEVAKLVGKKAGDNPHLWYDPATMPAVAKALAAQLAKLDPDHRSDYEARRDAFDASLKPIDEKIAALRQRYAGTAITATEPVAGYMAEAIHLRVRNPRFQLAIMNNTEPSASEIAAFQKDLKTRTVKVLLYNSQTSEELTEKMRSIAKDSGVPIVGVTETEPEGKKYQDWMLSELTALETGLSGKQP
ncbi:MAG TPA: zinc ABC transporter substrate-binding protein [Stellaceae bacterium]|jgi:zinc/manganese transport system substrate-binding protein|nr:zinc ABC transporter substrate-binding protein [Stellaceae bacterium]